MPLLHTGQVVSSLRCTSNQRYIQGQLHEENKCQISRWLVETTKESDLLPWRKQSTKIMSCIFLPEKMSAESYNGIWCSFKTHITRKLAISISDSTRDADIFHSCYTISFSSSFEVEEATIDRWALAKKKIEKKKYFYFCTIINWATRRRWGRALLCWIAGFVFWSFSFHLCVTLLFLNCKPYFMLAAVQSAN